MTDEFDILEYLSGLTGYTFDKAVLQRIALEREVSDVFEFSELDAKTRELLRADLLYCAYLSPTVKPSQSVSHGSFSNTIGSQTISSEEKERLYNIFVSIYRKYEDDKLQEIENLNGSLQWL